MLLIALHLLCPSVSAADVIAGGETPELNIQTLRPTIDAPAFFRVEDAGLPLKTFTGRAYLSYTMAPLQYTSWDGVTTNIVDNLLQLDAIGALRFGDFRIGVDVPIYLRAFGGSEADATGLGDPALDAKYRFMDSRDDPLGLALHARASLPVSTATGSLASPGVGVDAAVIVDHWFGEKVQVAGNLGVATEPKTVMENVTWGSQALVGLGAGYVLAEKAGVTGELNALGVLSDLSNAKAWPIEATIGGWMRVGPDANIVIRPGVSLPLTDAVGAPMMRGLLSVAYDPIKPKDSDLDGLVDKLDKCITQAEDMDDWEDADGCPEPTIVRFWVYDTDGIEVAGAPWTLGTPASTDVSGATTPLEAGTYMVTSGDTTTEARIPTGPPMEVRLVVPAPRGSLTVKAVDKRKRPVKGVTFRAVGPTPIHGAVGDPAAPLRPGHYRVVGNAPGFGTAMVEIDVAKDANTDTTLWMLPSRADIVGDRIALKDSVYFDTALASIKPASFPLLDEVTAILLNHPEISKLRIEGHTDSQGDDAVNLKLSQDRADAVKTYLVSKGVSADRLVTVGLGETQPIMKGNYERAYAKNRRVDFFVVTRATEPPAGK